MERHNITNTSVPRDGKREPARRECEVTVLSGNNKQNEVHKERFGGVVKLRRQEETKYQTYMHMMSSRRVRVGGAARKDHTVDLAKMLMVVHALNLTMMVAKIPSSWQWMSCGWSHTTQFLRHLPVLRLVQISAITDFHLLASFCIFISRGTHANNINMMKTHSGTPCVLYT